MPGTGKLIVKAGKRFFPAMIEKRIASKAAVTVVDDIAVNAIKKRGANTSFRDSAKKIIDVEFEEILEKSAETIAKESKGKRIIRWLGKEAVGVGLFIATDMAFDHFFGDGADKPGDPKTEAELSDALDTALLTNTGHYSLLMSYERSKGGDTYYSDEANFINDIVTSVAFSKSSISGAELPDSLVSRLTSLTDDERSFAILACVRVAKELALYSPSPSSMRLLGLQGMASSVTNACPSVAYSILHSKAMLRGSNAETYSATQVLSYESLFEALRDKLADKYFNDTTSVFDLFDAFDGDLKPQDEDTLRSLYVSMLVSDDTSASQKGWWDKFKVDKDGKDDESSAVRNLTMLSSVDNDFRTLVAAINEDDKNRADLLIANLR